MSILLVEKKVLEKNDTIAERNRSVFRRHGILVLNMVSSPGAGKTSILERTLARLCGSIRIGVIEGDVQTDLDAQRMVAYGIPTVQIVTRGGCHLDASLVHDAIENLPLTEIDLLFIENVGNLVCPAAYDLGEAMKVTVISTTEGDDKPLKYPAMLHVSSALIINKTDLLPYVNCRIDTLKRNALQINPHLKVFETSCSTDAGIDEWCAWIAGRIVG